MRPSAVMAHTISPHVSVQTNRYGTVWPSASVISLRRIRRLRHVPGTAYLQTSVGWVGFGVMLRSSGLDRLLFPTGLLAFSGLPLNTLTAMGLTAVFVTACCLYDLVTRGRVHPAFLWGGLSVLAWAYVTRALVGGTAVWLAVAGWLTR